MTEKTTNPAAPKNAREFQVWEDGRRQGHREAAREIERLRTALAAERERIASALDAEADTTPCYEDEKVVRDCARLVRADFDYEVAERIAETADNA